MAPPDDPAHRLEYRATGDDILVRDPDEVDDEDGVFEVRMPIATTGQVRNDGDDPLSRDELNGMAKQLAEREIGVFPAHGADTMIAAGHYSPFEKLGVWADASIDSRESENVLMATARMPDPETLPAATGDYRQGLAILKEQAKRGIPQDASIGWRDDEDFTGGVDLMEASIVGIGADWRTNTGDEEAEVVARAAVEAGADPDELVATVRAAVAGDADPEDTHDMTEDTDPPDDEGGTTEDEQTADDGETTERAPDECPECGAEVPDGANYCPNCGEDLDGDDGDDADEEQEGDHDDKDDEEEDGEQSADTGEDTEETAPDDEQDADTEDVTERIATLEAAVEDLRNGDVDVDTPDAPDTDAEQDASEDDDTEDEPTDDRDADSPTQGVGDFR